MPLVAFVCLCVTHLPLSTGCSIAVDHSFNVNDIYLNNNIMFL